MTYIYTHAHMCLRLEELSEHTWVANSEMKTPQHAAPRQHEGPSCLHQRHQTGGLFSSVVSILLFVTLWK